ncbi:FAD-dependent oxidoreductase [Candidatus Aerophobetes bacterium]|uniref:FAD-dependent oxidoreductase n=1 Tax=Aerophobetes bacterium TaxID=2030807 RepID=A0A523QIV1_UNCAE|nr:MAG: FAD-dependent oxidoreductase [Candidatus Aerophobetes bacterium]
MELDFVLSKEEAKSTGKSELTYDLVIVGGGPAGLTAAVYAARKTLKILLISKDLGGQVLLTLEVENYMGYQYIKGRELVNKFKEQVSHFSIDQEIGEEVEKLSKEGEIFSILTRGGNKFRGRTAIIASGKRSRSLNVSGEKRLIGRGVSYCSVCDAPFFEGKEVAVIGGGNSAFEAALDLVRITPKICLIDIASTWMADPVLVEQIEREKKVTSFQGHIVKEIKGDDRVEGITIEPLDGGKTRSLSVQGVFIEIGLVPNSDFARSLVKLNEAGEVVVDCASRTNIPGLFAAGDVSSVPEKQIIIAAGEGAKATLTAYQYLLRSR